MMDADLAIRILAVSALFRRAEPENSEDAMAAEAYEFAADGLLDLELIRSLKVVRYYSDGKWAWCHNGDRYETMDAALKAARGIE